MALWFRIFGIFGLGVAAYFYYYDDQTVALVLAAVAVFAVAVSWVFQAVR